MDLRNIPDLTYFRRKIAFYIPKHTVRTGGGKRMMLRPVGLSSCLARAVSACKPFGAPCRRTARHQQGGTEGNLPGVPGALRAYSWASGRTLERP